MRFLFLNQYGPAETAPTARLLAELADYLRSRGHAVETIAQSERYRGRPASGGGRLRRELGALWAMTRAGLRRRSPKPDVVLAFSSPPGLLAVAALVAWWQGAVLAHWAMDLYPELAVALGEIRRGSLLHRAVRFAMSRAYRRVRLAVVLDEDMRAHLRAEYGLAAHVLPPWPSRQAEAAVAAAVAAGTGEREAAWTWLYSGNLGRAHEWQTLLDAQRVLEAKALPIRLVFQGDGAARPAAEAYAREVGLCACEWKDYVAEADLVPGLLACQALIVTQRPAARGLLWPSKLALLERLPRPILWVGSTRGAIAETLVARGDGVFEPGQAEAVAGWIEALYQAAGTHSTIPATRPSSEEQCARWEKLLREM